MFTGTIGEFSFWCASERPSIYQHYVENAARSFDFSARTGEDTYFLGIQTPWHGSKSQPALTILHTYEPGERSGFTPEFVIVPETGLLFAGAGEETMCFNLKSLELLWEDKAEVGLWGWARCGDFVLMSAELEFAVFDFNGAKRWTTFVEPPWEYDLRDGCVRLDVMGDIRSFELATGKRLS